MADPVDGTEIIIVRHGQTHWNLEGRIQGSGDSPLTKDGMASARKLGARLAGSAMRRPITCIYSSPIGRAKGTADIISRCFPRSIEVILEAGLRERSFGCLEGLTAAEQSERYPEVHARNKRREEEYACPGGGESRADVRMRAAAALRSIALRHPGERVLVVTPSEPPTLAPNGKTYFT